MFEKGFNIFKRIFEGKRTEKIKKEVSEEMKAPEKMKAPKEMEAPGDYWPKIVKEIYEKTGEIPDPLEIRAQIFLKILDIPFDLRSVPKEGMTEEERKKEEIIAKYLTNKAGVFIGEDLVSRDFRDLYPQGLPLKVKEVLNEDTLKIIEGEYHHLEEIKKRYGEPKKDQLDRPVHYFRLPGGIDLFLRGYIHSSKWQEIHGSFLKEINKSAQIICIEGISNEPWGKSLDFYWQGPVAQKGDFDRLMKEAVEGGFEGHFTQIDARGTGMPEIYRDKIKKFPKEFFEKYFKYLEKEHPNLARYLQSPEGLKEALSKHAIEEGFFSSPRVKTVGYRGKEHLFYLYVDEKGKFSLRPTFLELGRFLFSDALAAIRLHLIAKLMADGHLPKGPIIDYEGAGHLSSKSFFLENPGYAMLVVLRTIHHLKERGAFGFDRFYPILEKPNWPEVLEEICRLVFRKPEEDPQKSVEIGPNQKKLLRKDIDFLKIYNIRSEKVIPTDEEIEGMINLAYFSSAVKKGISPK